MNVIHAPSAQAYRGGEPLQGGEGSPSTTRTLTSEEAKPQTSRTLWILLGGTVAYLAHQSLKSSFCASKPLLPRTRRQVKTLSLWLACLVVWPFAWKVLFGECVSATPALIWPGVAMLAEMHSVLYMPSSAQEGSKRNVLYMDANTICSVTLALSGALGAYTDKKKLKLFLTAIVGCFAFVMPFPNMPPSTTEHLVLEVVQKAILLYSTGILLGGITSACV